MKFEIFTNVRNNRGQICTGEIFHQMTDSVYVRQCASQLQKDVFTQSEKQEMKAKLLPVVTWQASYADDKRSNRNAIPSGLYMLDIDHCDEQVGEIIKRAKKMQQELDIVYIGRSISGKGVRIVAECRPEFSTIKECQEWLSAMLGVEYDAACKDWARASYLVPDEYIHYLDGGIFTREPKCVYVNPDFSASQEEEQKTEPEPEQTVAEPAQVSEQADEAQEPMFKGIPFSDIIAQYFEITGESTAEGSRNTTLYKLAFYIRYICDFNESKIKRVLPALGLPQSEIDQLVHSACSAPRSKDMPRVLRECIETCQQLKLFDEESDNIDVLPDVESFADVFTTDEVPELPPVFKEWYDIAPDDFKLAVVLTMLPFLGTLGSKLRAYYFNGEVHSPSFICCVEAPQANGKSFARRLDNGILGELKAHDAEEREKLKAWNEARRAERDARVKLTKQELKEMMAEKPEALIRYIAPTASITEMLKKMVAAKGLHLIAFSEEIDTVHKALKRGFSDFSDILRKAFDNAEHGQDYASEQSFSGIVKLFYNAVYCGTPKAVRRFFPDVEDGMISRVIFVTFPDQSYKPIPTWGTFSKAQEEKINMHLNRLNMVSIVDGEVQEDYFLKMNFMVREMEKWCKAQQKYAQVTQDLTRDTFCRRSAVIGFRAAMLAFFLWGEKVESSIVRAKVKKFGVWVANCCLRQFIMRFSIESDQGNTLFCAKIFDTLPDEFSTQRLAAAIRTAGRKTPARNVVYRWKLAGAIEVVERGKYRKVKNEN